MISSGTLSERIKCEKMSVTRSTSGEQLIAYTTIEDNLPANVKFSKGSRAVDGGEVWHPTTIVITTRNYQQLHDVERITWDNKKYQVISVNADRVNMSITIVADLIDEGKDRI